METFIANLTGKIRRDRIGDREYIVAPLTLLVPGVLNGSKGPLLYPPDEVTKSTSAWNHTPMVVYHPQVNGTDVSARDPGILDAQGIGVILNTKVNGKLIAEGWFDIKSTERVDQRIIDALEAGKPIELSTGLFTENEPAPEGATFNGVAYSYIARNYKPDHLAILPDKVGACSIADGCGVLINKKEGETKVNDEAKKKIVDGLIANDCCGWVEEDREALSELSDNQLERLDAQAKKTKEAEVVANAAKKGFDTLTEDHKKLEATLAANEEKGKKKEEPTTNEPPTEEEWLKKAPEAVREDLEFARNEKKRQKDEVIAKLTEHVEDEEVRNEQKKRLESRSLPDLTADLTLLPKKKEEPARPASYLGASAPATNKQDQKDKDKENYLPLPTMNFKQSEEEGAAV